MGIYYEFFVSPLGRVAQERLNKDDYIFFAVMNLTFQYCESCENLDSTSLHIYKQLLDVVMAHINKTEQQYMKRINTQYIAIQNMKHRLRYISGEEERPFDSKYSVLPLADLFDYMSNQLISFFKKKHIKYLHQIITLTKQEFIDKYHPNENLLFEIEKGLEVYGLYFL